MNDPEFFDRLVEEWERDRDTLDKAKAVYAPATLSDPEPRADDTARGRLSAAAASWLSRPDRLLTVLARLTAVVSRHLVLGVLTLSSLLFAAAVLSIVSAIVFTALFGPVLSTRAILLVAIPFSAAALAGTCAHVWRSLREELTKTLQDLPKKGP